MYSILKPRSTLSSRDGSICAEKKEQMENAVAHCQTPAAAAAANAGL